MKRITAVLLIGLLVFSLAACGEDQKAEEAPKEDVAKEELVEEPEEEPTEEPAEEPAEEPEEEQESEPNTIETSRFKSVITGHEVIDSAMFPDKKILAVHLTYTNKSDEPENIWMSQGFKAEQETDVTVEILNGANGQYPDDYYPELVKTGNDVDIKPGATVDAIIGYELIDPEKPVYLRPFIGDDFEIILNE